MLPSSRVPLGHVTRRNFGTKLKEVPAMWCCVMASMLAWAEPAPTDLAPPVRLLAGGQPINVDIGHAAPFVADLKGEGKRSEEHTSELQSRGHLVCRLLLEKKKSFMDFVGGLLKEYINTVS